MIESIDESEIDQSRDHENKEWDHKCHVMNLESSTILMLNKRLKTMIAKIIDQFANILSYLYSHCNSIKNSYTNDVLASRRRTLKFDKIFSYHDKLIKKHRDYVRNLTTTFRLILDDFSTKNFKIVYVMQSLVEKSKKI
jgi:hypothetical protein